MDISKNNIDKKFAKKLAGHESQPRAEAWQKLEGRLQKKEDKPVAISWASYTRWAVAASLLLVAGTWYFSADKKPIDAASQLSQNNTKTQPKLTENVVGNTTKIADSKIKTNKPKAVEGPKNIVLRYNQLAQNIVVNPKQQAANTHETIKNEAVQLPKADINEKAIVPTANIVAEAETKKAEVEPLTIVFNVANFKNTEPILASNETEKTEKKKGYLNRLFKQLKNAKNGDKVDWQEVGFKPAKILARAENKLKASEEEIKDGYYEVKERTSF